MLDFNNCIFEFIKDYFYHSGECIAIIDYCRDDFYNERIEINDREKLLELKKIQIEIKQVVIAYVTGGINLMILEKEELENVYIVYLQTYYDSSSEEEKKKIKKILRNYNINI